MGSSQKTGRGKEIEAVYLRLHNDYPDLNSEGYVQYLYSQFTQYPNNYKFLLNHKSTINQLISAVFINLFKRQLMILLRIWRKKPKAMLIKR